MLQFLLDLCGGVFGAWCFMRCFERLTKISWFDARPASVLMYLAGTLWSAWIVHDAVLTTLEWYQVGSLVFVACVIVITKHKWEHGVPAEVTTKPGDLVPVERRKSDRRRAF